MVDIQAALTVVQSQFFYILGNYGRILSAVEPSAVFWDKKPVRNGLVSDFFEDFFDVMELKHEECFSILFLAVLLTLIRIFSSSLIFLPLGKYFKIELKSLVKFPESGFKSVYYMFTWCYCYYLLFCSGSHNYFTDHYSTWENWSPGMYIDPLLYWFYMLQLSFYIHSIYATLVLDEIRKDFFAMMLHHFVTIFLIFFSFCCRYHRVGLMVLYVHDFCDVCLEFTKCLVYFKVRDGKHDRLMEALSNAGFAVFTISWVYFRLYLFPCYALYSAFYYSILICENISLYFFFNGMLFTLLLLHLYWFTFIVSMLFKVLLGYNVDDSREAPSPRRKVKKL
eukprot:Sdes_comp15499_c0_seq1m4432